MSTILCVAGFDPAPDLQLENSLRRLFGERTSRAELWRRRGVAMAVGRRAWQLSDDFCGPVGVLADDDLVVAADASLYYRDELRARLREAGYRGEAPTPSHLLAQAYRVWEDELVRRLDGDFAFVIWDRRRERLLAARDRMGYRPLYYARLSNGVALSSSARALTRLPGCSEDLDLANLGQHAAGLDWSSGWSTAFNDVGVLAPAHVLRWERGELRTDPYWDLPTSPEPNPVGIDEAAEELRRLLGAAVDARLGSDVTTVWMSGGRDSPAVFAAGRSLLRKRGAERRIRPVCISYPEGDVGWEDRTIKEIAARWDALGDIRWIRSDGIPLVEGLAHRASRYDEPPAHLYELWNRALARGTRAAGSRIALDGAGGDNLFQISGVDLADHLRHGRIGRFARVSWKRRRLGLRHLARTGILPLLPPGLLRTGERLGRRTLAWHYLERPICPWIRDDFIRAHGLRERELAAISTARANTFSQSESLFRLIAPGWGWSASFMRTALLEEGVEVRSPLLDRRIVDLALSRPVHERADGLDAKVLLRRAMEGLLPASVTAHRPYRTGTTVGFTRQRMNEEFPALFRALLSRPLRLAELGIVDPAVLERSLDNWGHETPVADRDNLFNTMKVEFWLRGLDSSSIATAGPPVRMVSAPTTSSVA